MESQFTITFTGDDMALETIAKGLDAYADYTVELAWQQNVAPACANPVYVIGTSVDGETLRVYELDDDASPIRNSTHLHRIPINHLSGVTVL